MQNFLFSVPTRIRFGPGTIDSVGQEAAAHGRHALLVTGSTFARRSGLIDHIRQSLDGSGVGVTIYDEIEPSPTVKSIDDGGRAARAAGADLVIGLGGGSAMDAAKGIAAAAQSNGSIWDYARHTPDAGVRSVERALPIVQVPIIASTGSETNNTAIVHCSEVRMKAPVIDDALYARAAVIDPILTFTVPARYTVVGGMNIITRMLEGYLTSDEFAVTDRVTEGLMRVVMDGLPRALRRAEDLDARNNLSWAASLASTIALAGRGAAAPLRAMAYPLTAHFNLEHGTAVAALWPSYMRYALSNRLRLPQIGRFKRYALLGRQIFGVHETDDEVAAETTTYRFSNWLRGLDMPTDLRQMGIEEGPLAELATQAVTVSGDGKRLPGGLTAHDIEHIYEGALRQVGRASND